MNPPESPSKLIDSSDHRHVTQPESAHLRDATLKMMCRTIIVLSVVLYLPCATAQTPEARRNVVERLQREADRFIEQAPQIQASEILTQTRAPRIQRTIVSSYGFLALQPGKIREIRQVQVVDGKVIKKQGDPLKALAQSLTAADDKQQRKLLEGFEKHGLKGVAVDFGPVIQMFSAARIQTFEFLFHRMDRLGEGPVAVYRYEQIDGTGSLTIYSEGKPIRQKLRGEVWVRPADGLPVRIVLDSEFEEGKGKMRDVTFVDYGQSEFGTLVPLTVGHRQFHDRTILVQDLFQYSAYRKAQ
jgi:hypothetical protein